MKNILLNNYHTHTSRCKHALGTDEEYVLNAIKHGMKSLGFSDHIPLKHYESTYWKMEYHETNDYIDSIRVLKEKYKDQIEIYIGFESEYLLEEVDFYRELLENNAIDYLILGAHLHDYYDLNHCIIEHPTKEKIEEYADHCIKQMENGLFKYLCHPDLYMKSYEVFDNTCLKAAHKICKRSKELRFPIELNCEGIRSGFHKYGDKERFVYPIEEFWKIAGEYQCPVVIGVDAHKPEDLDSESIQIAFEWIKKFNLNHIKDNKIEI